MVSHGKCLVIPRFTFGNERARMRTGLRRTTWHLVLVRAEAVRRIEQDLGMQDRHGSLEISW